MFQSIVLWVAPLVARKLETAISGVKAVHTLAATAQGDQLPNTVLVWYCAVSATASWRDQPTRWLRFTLLPLR